MCYLFSKESRKRVPCPKVVCNKMSAQCEWTDLCSGAGKIRQISFPINDIPETIFLRWCWCNIYTNSNSSFCSLGSMAPSERKRIWKIKRVFFLTPQVLTNDLSRQACPAVEVKCLVVDEAHKALGNHAYCEVRICLSHVTMVSIAMQHCSVAVHLFLEYCVVTDIFYS